MKFSAYFLLTALMLTLTAFVVPGDPCSSGITYYSMEEALQKPSDVKVLDLAMQSPTKLTTLPPEIGKLTELECLDISFNRISTLPAEMKELKKLKKINLAGNRYLSKIPDVLKEMPWLEEVDVTGIPEWSKEKCDAAKAALPNVKVLTDK